MEYQEIISGVKDAAWLCSAPSPNTMFGVDGGGCARAQSNKESCCLHTLLFASHARHNPQTSFFSCTLNSQAPTAVIEGSSVTSADYD
jgi:hypothetical protein